MPKRECFARLGALLNCFPKVMDFVKLLHFRLHPNPADQRHRKHADEKAEV